jgi:hypothetical protein
VEITVPVQALTVAAGQLPAPLPTPTAAGVCTTPANVLVALTGTVAATVTVPGLVAVGLAVLAMPLQEFNCERQSVPENAEPASAAQELNWCVQAAEAADGRSMNVSSRTMKVPMLPVTPGAAPPRERTKMKKEITSMRTVVVAVLVVAVVERAVVVALVVVARRALVVVAKEVSAVVVAREAREVVLFVRSAVVVAREAREVVLFVRSAVVVARETTEVVLFVRSAVVEAREVVLFVRSAVVAARETTEVVLFVRSAVVEAVPTDVTSLAASDVDEVATEAATEVFVAFVVVAVLASVITHDVAAPLPSSLQTIGWKAAGGQVSCVKDMRYRSQRNVNRLFPTHVSGEGWMMKMLSKPFRNGGAAEIVSLQ